MLAGHSIIFLFGHKTRNSDEANHHKLLQETAEIEVNEILKIGCYSCTE